MFPSLEASLSTYLIISPSTCYLDPSRGGGAGIPGLSAVVDFGAFGAFSAAIIGGFRELLCAERITVGAAAGHAQPCLSASLPFAAKHEAERKADLRRRKQYYVNPSQCEVSMHISTNLGRP
jgi:hypothetical protein